MPRPFDWFVVTISLVIWWTHGESTDAAPVLGTADSHPFAYVNEDGSLTPLPGIYQRREEAEFASPAVVVRIGDDPALLGPASRRILMDRRPAVPAEANAQWLREPVL
jgi:hypothetical protein